MIKTGYSSIPEKLHVVVTGETGRALSFVVRRDSIAVVAILGMLAFSLLAAGSWLGVGFFRQKNALADKAASQSSELESLRARFAEQIRQEVAERERSWQQQAAEQASLVSSLRAEKEEILGRLNAEKERILGALGEEKEQLVCSYEEEIAALQEASSAKFASLLTELEQERKARRNILEKTAVRLDERSRVIESLMSRIGVDVKIGRKPTSSGGPFLAAEIDEKYSEQLLERSDRYIQAIQKMPLGRPMKGQVTSGFGRRSDPFNGRPAFHAGVDFKGRIGDKVLATADGVVKESGHDAGGYGNYVTVTHGNGYETLFGHLSKSMVRKGDKVKFGDVLGLMGNSGRSTGPHLHYELHFKGKALDPKKYLSVADLSFTVPM